MLGFLFFTIIAVALFGTAGLFVMVPILAISGLIWLIALPLKLVGFVFGGLFRLVFGVLGALLGLIVAPIVMLVVGVALIGALLAAALALVAPLIPVVLLLLLGWGVFKLSARRNHASGVV